MSYLTVGCVTGLGWVSPASSQRDEGGRVCCVPLGRAFDSCPRRFRYPAQGLRLTFPLGAVSTSPLLRPSTLPGRPALEVPSPFERGESEPRHGLLLTTYSIWGISAPPPVRRPAARPPPPRYGHARVELPVAPDYLPLPATTVSPV